MTKPWMERWEADADMVLLLAKEHGHDVIDRSVAKVFEGHDDPMGYSCSRAQLAAAAPALARALCLAEQVLLGDEHEDGGAVAYLGCAVCGELSDANDKVRHKPDCSLDQALTAAGLTPELREEVRRGR